MLDDEPGFPSKKFRAIDALKLFGGAEFLFLTRLLRLYCRHDRDSLYDLIVNLNDNDSCYDVNHYL